MADPKPLRAVPWAFCLLAAGLGGCKKTPAAQEVPASIPKPLCAQVDAAVADARTKAGIVIEGNEATIDEAVWRTMGPGQEALARALAFHVACAAGRPPEEQAVIIRNESGRVLMDQRVTIMGIEYLEDGS